MVKEAYIEASCYQYWLSYGHHDNDVVKEFYWIPIAWPVYIDNIYVIRSKFSELYVCFNDVLFMTEEFGFEVDGNPFAIANIDEVWFISLNVELVPTVLL